MQTKKGLIAAGLCLAMAGCGRKSAGDRDDKGRPGAMDTRNREPARKDVNRIELLTWTGHRQLREWKKFSGTFAMRTAVVAWEKDVPCLVLDTGEAGCAVLRSGSGKGPKSTWTRATVILKPLTPAQRKGEVSLKSTAVQIEEAVILARGFNAVLWMNLATPHRTLRFLSGRLKPGETVTGTMHLDDGVPGRKRHSVIRGAFRARVCAPERKPQKEPLPPALGKCPEKTEIKHLRQDTQLDKVGPFDWKTFTRARIRLRDGGARLEIFITNQDYPVDRMSSLMSPVKAAGHGILRLTLDNGKKRVTIGEYVRGGYRKPLTALAELRVKGRDILMGIGRGRVRIIDMRGGKICGDFEIKTLQATGSGTFVADLPTR